MKVWQKIVLGLFALLATAGASVVVYTVISNAVTRDELCNQLGQVKAIQRAQEVSALKQTKKLHAGGAGARELGLTPATKRRSLKIIHRAIRQLDAQTCGSDLPGTPPVPTSSAPVSQKPHSSPPHNARRAPPPSAPQAGTNPATAPQPATAAPAGATSSSPPTTSPNGGGSGGGNGGGNSGGGGVQPPPTPPPPKPTPPPPAPPPNCIVNALGICVPSPL